MHILYVSNCAVCEITKKEPKKDTLDHKHQIQITLEQIKFSIKSLWTASKLTFYCGKTAQTNTTQKREINVDTWIILNTHIGTHAFTIQAMHTAAVRGQTATCVRQHGHSYPPRISIYYKTNNRKLGWLRCENSNNPHPCVSFLPLFSLT